MRCFSASFGDLSGDTMSFGEESITGTMEEMLALLKPHREEAISSLLHDEARVRNWSVVLSLCRSSPRMARYKNPDGWTALHHACNRRPPADVVEALLLAFPGALLEQRCNGMTPLHEACRFKNTLDVVRLLVTFDPELGREAVSMRCKKGRAPLYYAIRYDAPPGVMDILLEAGATNVLEKNNAGETPVSYVWDAYAMSYDGRNDIQNCLQDEQRRMCKTLSDKWDTICKMLKKAYIGEWNVLHAVSSVKCHIYLFMLAKHLHPQNISAIDSLTGMTALHCAAATQATGDLVVRLVAAFPEACKIKDKWGSLPLHLATANSSRIHWVDDGLSCIHQNYPDAISVTDRKGRTPLHLAVMPLRDLTTDHHPVLVDEQQSIILNLLNHCPDAARESDHQGNLPLHLLALHAHHKDHNAEGLLNVNRIALKTRNTQGRLPIHLAASNINSQSTLLHWLLHHHPMGVLQGDKHGILPIHLACKAGKQWNLCSIMYQAHPKSIYAKDCLRQWSAMHYAASGSKADLNLIRNLLEKGAVAHEPDKRGRYPIHLACAAGMNWEEGLKRLFDAFPDAGYISDDFGYLPLHHAMLKAVNNRGGKGKHATSDATTENEMQSIADQDERDDLAVINTLYNLLVLDPAAFT